LLPPGAGGTLLRSATYFDGHGALGPVGVLIGWTLLGVGGIVVGHRRAAHDTDALSDAGRHAALEPVG
jgi:hypothetical protein